MSLGLAGLADETYVAEAHLLGNLEVDSALCGIHIGVHRHDDNVIDNSLSHNALHHIFARYTPQPAEDERVMRHDEVAALADGLIHGIFGHVKTQ